MVTVIPAAEALISDRQTTGSVVGTAADRCRHAFIAIVAISKAGFASQFQIDLTLLLSLFGDDIDKTTGTAAAVERGGAGDHLNVFNVKRID